MLFGQFRTPLMGACALALVFVPLAKAQSTLFNWPGGCQVYNVPTASCPPVTFTGAWAPATTYQLNQVVTYSGSQYISIQNSNTGQNPATATAYWAQPFISGNPTVGQTLTWNGSSFGLAVAGAANVKLFGATGNGTTDDTAAIQNALAFMATNGGCIYFPAGVYKTAAQLNWNNMLTPSGTAAAPLCLRGDSWRSSYIVYSGSASVDAAIHVENNMPPETLAAVDITNLGIAANINAKYAFHGISVGPPSNMDNVAFAGGWFSSFGGNAWNGLTDLRNLFVGPQFFSPVGVPDCVNGLTFDSGPSSNTGTTIPSSQFALTMPAVSGCGLGATPGVGLNLQQAFGVVINGGQFSGNHQNVYQNCTLGPVPVCQDMGVTFNNILDEGPQVPTQILGDRNLLNGYYADSAPPQGGVQIGGLNNVVLASQGAFQTLASPPGSLTAFGTAFLASVIWPASSDAGTNTYGVGNMALAGGLAGPPWNSIAMITGSVMLTGSVSGSDTFTLTGVRGVPTPSLCSFTPTNSIAAGVQPWYTVGTNTLTLNYPSGVGWGATYSVTCN